MNRTPPLLFSGGRTEGPSLCLCRGTIEGVVFVDGRPRVERADMPLSLYFHSIEELERFCEMVREMGRERH